MVMHARPWTVTPQNMLGPAAIIFPHFFERRTGRGLSIRLAITGRALRRRFDQSRAGEFVFVGTKIDAGVAREVEGGFHSRSSDAGIIRTRTTSRSYG